MLIERLRCDKDEGDIWKSIPEVNSESPAVHSRHAEVRNDQAGATTVAITQRLGAGFEIDARMTSTPEKLSN